MTHETGTPLINGLLVLVTIAMTAVSDFSGNVDFILTLVTRLISILSFVCFLVLNFDSLVLRVKKIFRNGK